ncbi:unnamed protein product [Adineta ricciae]|uniref:DDE-1 domain-containing protein n=1 Tax=Adineta ricciae TaxID=249248 RepID=A0A815RVH3_ADIRI|nr:unnamed protein product [Adineta ricciae]
MTITDQKKTIAPRGRYDKEQLIDAVTAVLDGEMTSVLASTNYGVPQSTIRMHTTQTSLDIGSGRPVYLDKKKEGYLVDLIKSLECAGVRLTKNVLKKVIGEYIISVSDTQRLKSEWVCVSNETKIVYEEDGGSGKAFTTVVVAGNAAGMSLPPFVIYGAKNVNPLWTQNGPDRSQYHCSAKGWINEDLFAKWLEHLSIPETASIQRPLLLIMDNLSPHISIKAIEIAQKHGIILLCLPPNTTHALQPFDVCPFGSVGNSYLRIPTFDDSDSDLRYAKQSFLHVHDFVCTSMIQTIRSMLHHREILSGKTMIQSILVYNSNKSYLSSSLSYILASGEDLTTSNNESNTKSTCVAPKTNALMSPQSATKSIIAAYSKDHTTASSTQSTRTSSRIRVQRKSGEGDCLYTKYGNRTHGQGWTLLCPKTKLHFGIFVFYHSNALENETFSWWTASYNGLCNQMKYQKCRWWFSDFQPLTLQMYDKSFQIAPKRFLVEQYGPKWMTPQRYGYFESLEFLPNLIIER